MTPSCSYSGRLFSLPCGSKIVDIGLKENWINGVLNDCRIIDQNSDWSQSSFYEAYYIKTPEINDGLKKSF